MKGNHISKSLLISLLALLPMMGWAQVFKHYEGYANKSGDYEVIDAANGCLRQKTHEYHYYIPVAEGAGSTVDLPLPFAKYANGGDPLEPRGFFRWYNYDTDCKSSNLSAASASSKLMMVQDENHVEKGLMAYNIGTNAVKNNVGVIYTRPADANWDGEVIACDVSRYIDCLEGGKFVHESTISMRYVFHVIPARKRADEIRDAILNGLDSKVNDLTFEDNKEMSVGFKDESSTMTIRLNANSGAYYWFHPMNNSGGAGANTHHVYYNDEKFKIQPSDFTSDEVLQPNRIQWRVYNSEKNMVLWFTQYLASSPRFYTVQLADLNTYTWKYLNGATVPEDKKPKITYGSRVYLVAMAVSADGRMCPIANFAVTFYSHYPQTAEQLKANNQNTRLVSYLDEHYRPVATESFDDVTDGQTLDAPTNENDNQAQLPLKWNAGAYGFVYRDLINKNVAGGMWINPKHSPLHGEYGLYKSANVSGISGEGDSFANNYLWYPKNVLYDRTYENSGGSQYGYFFYVDAADESRQIVETDFKANLCAGSQVIFSSAIADFTTGNAKPELLFKLYGVHYDENNKETDRKLLHSFSTGNLENNVDDFGSGKWYQGYGKMILPKESGVNNYENFKIVVDNLCRSTEGADYAFDDLRVYTKATKVDVLQSTPICPSVDLAKDATTPTTVLLKLRALQATMAALAEYEPEKKLYYRFVNADGTPAENVNYGTTAEPNMKWGTTTIYKNVDASRKVDGGAMYEDVDNETYVILANRYFNLEADKTYYLSLAFDDESVSDKEQLEWGKPSDVCSLYSENFQMVQQKVVVTDANGNIATSITIPCDDDATPEYNIQAELQTVDQNNGGSINLKGVLFDWYIDDEKQAAVSNSAEFKNVKLEVGEHTIRVRPVNETETIIQGGVSYQICLEDISFKLRVVKNGPQLEFGMDGVTYPKNYTRTVRLGLPQVKALALQEAAGKGGYLHIPVSGKNFIADNSTKLYFVEEAGKDELANAKLTNVMYLSGTNDPCYQNRLGENLKLAVMEDNYIDRNSNKLAVKFMPQVSQAVTSSTDVQLHEGYWYEGILIFREDGTKGTTVLCAGESYVRFEVVPEYVTWNPTASNKMSAAWNNDQNWMRSTRSELYKGEDYPDYVATSNVAKSAESDVNIARQNSYVPMKFTKVTIPNLSGLYFPDLGYIAYQKSNGIATKLSNSKGDAATTHIQYAMMAKWDAADEGNHGMTADGNLECETWYGNACDQIYFKPGGELLDQCYLIYNKAWVEKELKPNTWYALTSPLQDTYAGDMFVPKASGRQETEAFLPISFSESNNNRVTSPVYQRSWDDTAAEEVKLTELGTEGSHKAYDYSGTGISFENQNLTALSANWSHVYNKVDKAYAPMEGFAMKMYDKYTEGNISNTSASEGNASSVNNATLLMRLPKADPSYTYYDKGQSGSAITASLDKANAYRLVVDEDKQEGALAKMSLPLAQLSDGNVYYLVGNPYMATLSMYKFVKANPAVSPTFYVYENGQLKLYDKMDLSSSTYESKNDVTVAPMQSFFIRLAEGQTADQINFTSAMTVDREVMGGVKTQDGNADATLLSLQARQGNYSSEAKVVVSSQASAEYDGGEDAELLYDTNLKDLPTLYTVAGEQAVAVNAVPSIDWVPLGVVSDGASASDSQMAADNESVALSIKGISSLGTPLYLYDAETKLYRELHEGEALGIAANQHGRYFLTLTRGTTGIDTIENADAGIKIYSPTAGSIVVASVGSAIYNKVEVYTVDGQLVASRNVAGTSSTVLNVKPSSIYVVKVTLASANQVITRKLSIR